MKICYIANSALPSDNASSLQIINMCHSFELAGNKTILILPNTGFSKSVKKFYNLKKNIKIIRCRNFKKFPIGVNYYLYAFVAIIKSLNFKIDYYMTRNYFCAFLLHLLGKKIIFELHHDLQLEGKIIRFLVSKLKFFKHSNFYLLVAITKGVAKYYLNKDIINKKKLIILPSASELKIKYQPQKFYKKKFCVGYFGNFYKSRGSEFILKLANKDTRNDYYIFSNFKKLDKNILFKKDNIFQMNFVDRSKISYYLKKMDILILPYQNKITVKGNVGDITKYTSPMKLFDYLASGKLILSSNLNVLKEIIEHNKNCIFIKNYKNEDSWIKKIEYYKRYFDKKNLISKQGYLLSKKYTYASRVNRIIKELKIL
ncbi:glycosyltransferase [Candidatus Pelagibacter sp.]|nr:glycosyltransferase [Candidatus Pelagibacter sp.]